MSFFKKSTAIPVDTVERVLQFHVALLSVVAGLLVDLNRDGQPVSPFLAVGAVMGFVLSDYLRWFYIPRFLVGVITLGAIFPLSLGFWQADTQGQLNLISYLLTIWLTVIFFQQKTPRVYGSLIVLSLLLVVIAAILSSGLPFAILLLTYEFIGLSALVLLYVHSGQNSLQSKYRAGLTQIPADSEPLRNPYGSLLGRPPVAFQDPGSLPQRGRMWHNATISHTAAMCLATVIFGLGFFYAVPRVSQGDWTTPRRIHKARVGFTAELTFDEMSRILESDELAFRISYMDARTGKDYELVQEAYIQGLALTQYTVDSQGKTSWRQYDRGAGRPLMEIDPNHTGDIVRQEILLQPTTETTLFAIPAVFRGSDTGDFIRMDRQAGRIFRPQVEQHAAGRQQRYVVYTTGCRNNAQMPLVPVNRMDPLTRAVSQEIGAAEKERLLAIDRKRFPVLTQVAQKIATQSQDSTNRISIARQLQDQFHSKDRYTYTLDFAKVKQLRNEDIDPIEDFVANHHTGHCEYFASALALMLRSVDIPSRVVVGYYGGEYNRLGGYYQVYQRDAHAWVEAYLEPDQVPRGPLSEAIPEGGAAWYRLDPTPPEEEDMEDDSAFSIDQVLDYAQLLWNDYVLDMDPGRQQPPLIDSEAESRTLANMPMAARVREFLVRWWAGPQAFLAAWRREGWWNWRGGVVAAVVTALVYWLVHLARWLRVRWSMRRKKVKGHSCRVAPTIEFYRRLEGLLAKIGCERRSSETQREFAIAAGQSLAQSAPDELAASIPARIVEYFYRVRFGNQQLAPGEEQEIENFLQNVDEVVNAPHHQANGNGRTTDKDAPEP